MNLGRIFVGAPRDVVELEKDLSHNEASFRWASAVAVAAAAGCGVGVALKGTTTTTTMHLHIADVASLLQFGPDSDWARPLRSRPHQQVRLVVAVYRYIYCWYIVYLTDWFARATLARCAANVWCENVASFAQYLP